MLFKYTTIFCFSFLINSFLISLIKLGLFGNSIKNKYNSLTNKQINKIIFVVFLFVLLLLTYLQLNIIYLDESNVEVKTVINGMEVKVSGDFLKLVLTQFGSAAVFATGLRVGQLVVAKNMHTLGKVGVIGATASGYSLMYKVIANTNNTISSNLGDIALKSNKIEISVDMPIDDKINKVANIIPDKESALNNIVTNLLGENFISLKPKFELKNTITIENKPEVDINILGELNKINPNWKDLFINSPLENNNLTGINHVIDLLNTNLSLHFIILYLLFMLLFIFTSKILIEKNINLEGIKILPLGYYIHFIFNKLINIWKFNANV